MLLLSKKTVSSRSFIRLFRCIEIVFKLKIEKYCGNVVDNLFKLNPEHYCANVAENVHIFLFFFFFSNKVLTFIHVNFPTLLSFLYLICIFVTYDFTESVQQDLINSLLFSTPPSFFYYKQPLKILH